MVGVDAKFRVGGVCEPVCMTRIDEFHALFRMLPRPGRLDIGIRVIVRSGWPRGTPLVWLYRMGG